MDKAQNLISDLEYKEAKNNQPEQQEEKRIHKSEDSVGSLRNNFKHTNIHINGGARRRERTQEIGNLFEEIMTKNFPNLVKELDIKVQEAQTVPNKINPKRPTLRHIIIKTPEVKIKRES